MSDASNATATAINFTSTDIEVAPAMPAVVETRNVGQLTLTVDVTVTGTTVPSAEEIVTALNERIGNGLSVWSQGRWYTTDDAESRGYSEARVSNVRIA